MSVHRPVLLQEIIEFLSPVPGGRYIDCTAGGGGHLEAIAERIRPDGKVIGIEWDTTLCQELSERYAKDPNIEVINASYRDILTIAQDHQMGQVHGILFDLGFSSWHPEHSERGFSFQKKEVLDMRYNPADQSESAQDLVNTWSEHDLTSVLREYGQERFSHQIAHTICTVRKKRTIRTTTDLVQIIESSVPARYTHQKIHHATRTFQALRIAVNRELENITEALPDAVSLLAPGGTIAAISFHSLEDRIVKQYFRSIHTKEIEILTKKPITASRQEIEENPRARSAKLRIAKKI